MTEGAVELFQQLGGEYVARFTPAEAAVVRHLVGQVVALVGRERLVRRPGGGSPEGTADPVLDRMFPDGYTDATDAAEFRDLTEEDLRAAKLDQAKVVLRSLPAEGGEVRLDPADAESWLRALTDVRLALGIRLELTDETDVQAELDDAVLRDPTSPRVAQLSVYGYLTYLQESLVLAISGH